MFMRLTQANNVYVITFILSLRELEDEGENSSNEVPQHDRFESNAIEQKVSIILLISNKRI